jgi:hypothetical protein
MAFYYHVVFINPITESTITKVFGITADSEEGALVGLLYMCTAFKDSLAGIIPNRQENPWSYSMPVKLTEENALELREYLRGMI